MAIQLFKTGTPEQEIKAYLEKLSPGLPIT